MFLAKAIATDETAVICDLAQTYGVLHYRSLPVPLLAALVAGLGEDSRIGRKMSGAAACADTLLLAAAVDRLGLLYWAKTEDGAKGRNRPQSILDILTNSAPKTQERETMKFETPEDFWRAWEGVSG